MAISKHTKMHVVSVIVLTIHKDRVNNRYVDSGAGYFGAICLII